MKTKKATKNIIILLLTICNFVLVMLLMITTQYNHNIKVSNNISTTEESVDTNNEIKYKNVEVHYSNKSVLGLINEDDALKVETPHTKIYCYQIEEINTDDIDNITIR